MAGLLINYAFSFEDSNTKISIFDNSGIIISYITDILVFGVALSLERVIGIVLIITPLVLLTLHK